MCVSAHTHAPKILHFVRNTVGPLPPQYLKLDMEIYFLFWQPATGLLPKVDFFFKKGSSVSALWTKEAQESLPVSKFPPWEAQRNSPSLLVAGIYIHPQSQSKCTAAPRTKDSRWVTRTTLLSKTQLFSLRCRKRRTAENGLTSQFRQAFATQRHCEVPEQCTRAWTEHTCTPKVNSQTGAMFCIFKCILNSLQTERYVTRPA